MRLNYPYRQNLRLVPIPVRITSFKNIVRLIIAFSLPMAVAITVQAQSSGNLNYPEIGKQCPPFSFKNIRYSDKMEISLGDSKSQPIILYFWSSNCSFCIRSFPKLNELSSKFKGKVQFLLIGIYDKHVQQIFERFRQKFNLRLPIVYDSIVYRKFAIDGVPHVIWINNKMIIKAITSLSEDINEKNIEDFANDKSFIYTDYSNKAQLERGNAYDYTKPYLINGNGGGDTDFLFRSVLMNAKPNSPQEIPPFIGVGRTGYIPEINDHWVQINRNMVQGSFMSISMLYDLAYGDTIPHYPTVIDGKPLASSFGQYWIKPILEIKDSAEFKTDLKTAKNYYTYSLVVPERKATTLYVQSIMQRDLKNYFGFNVEIEPRLMPYWKLTCSKETAERVLSKGGPTMYERNAAYIKMKNCSIKCLINALWSMNQDAPPFIDETGIIENIDLTIDADITDFEEFKNVLHKNGFYLTKGEKKMKTIVIKDSN